MSWNGIGIASANSIPISGNAAFGKLPTMEPSLAWTGSAGTGFSALPADPVRVTAKPALRLLTPPFQHFTDTLDVGVIAFANDSGTLIGGIDRVRFHFEGNSVDVVAPRVHSFVNARGTVSKYFGYWVSLKRPTGKSGSGLLYAEAIPADATMQSRVIGPFTFCPRATQYDAIVTVNPDAAEVPDVNYLTLSAAMTRARVAGWINPLITIAKPGVYGPPTGSVAANWARSGYVNITASVPGVVLGYPSPPMVGNSDSQQRFGVDRMKVHLFGPNLTLDFANFAQLLRDGAGAGADHWLDGITLTASTGRLSFLRGNIRSGVSRVEGNAWFTECVVSNLNSIFNGANLVRGCTANATFQDAANGVGAIVQSTFEDHNSLPFNANEPAFEVQYTGPEAVATIARRGRTVGAANADGDGLYRVRIGSATYDFRVGTGSEANWQGSGVDGFFFADVVAWLNTLPNVTATLLIGIDRTASTGSLGPADNSDSQFGTKGNGWGFPANATTAPLSIKTKRTVTSYYDLHGDWYQHPTGTIENSIVWGNRVWNCPGQMVFLAPIGTSAAQRDVFFVGNAFHRPDDIAAGNTDGAGNASQWGRNSGNLTVSHCVLAHNSFAGQRLLCRGNASQTVDSYSMLSNNAIPGLGIDTLAWTGKRAENNHIRAGDPTPPIGSNYVKGGISSAEWYVDVQGGDFAATGALRDNLRKPLIALDLNGHAAPASAPVGAVLS